MTTRYSEQDCKLAFDAALRHGHFSQYASPDRNVANWMYMFTTGSASDPHDCFKHIDTRQNLRFRRYD